MASLSPDGGKKRWSTMFKKRDKSTNLLPTVPGTEQESSSSLQQQSTQHDSAYASSEPPSMNSDANIVPVENHGRFNNVSSDRNLVVNKTTGDVLDQDTGEVVSTITTTTTTTTTTTLKKGRNGETVVEVQTHPAGQTSQTASSTLPGQPANVGPAGQKASSGPSEVVEAPADNAISADSLRARHESAQHPPSSHPGQSLAPVLPPIQQRQSPIIPARSPHRSSRELDSVQSQGLPPNASTPGYNFSHPSRASLRQSDEFSQTPVQQTQQGPYPPLQAPYSPQQVQYPNHNAQPASRSTMDSLKMVAKEHAAQSDTFQDLKAVAKGLHGMGETLRGTLNNEMDTRYTRNPEKANAVAIKNQAIIERGRAEMQMGRRYEQHEGWNSAGGPATVHMVSPIEPNHSASQWQERTRSRSSSRKGGLRKLIKKKKSGGM